jgi:hypothetical protein
MSTATLTPEAKSLLASTIRGLRERLLRDLSDEAERRYRFSVAIGKAGLDEAHRRRRERIEAWLDERVRAGGATSGKAEKDRAAARDRYFQQAIKEAAATLLNRLVLLRHLEALGLSRPAVVTGGWNSKGYQELRDFAPALTGDETEGYSTLLQIIFDDLAIELPGLFGDVGLTRLFLVPPATLREIVSRLDDERLVSAWTDDTTLGWVYQYWNDPEREALDAKIADGGKVQPHEIASKTQMFTERYMVEWLLQNSLGPTWLCICRRNGWTADAERVLPGLEGRRAEWRAKREAGEVAPDALMPIEGELEDAWKYYVRQPLPVDAQSGEGFPLSIRDVRLLDPACGSGHFLTAAFDLLVLLHREESRHRGEIWSDAEIANSVLSRNLHGIDIDPRAVQIAAAGLYLKAKALAPLGQLIRVNLVAPTLQLGNLADDDPALLQLRRDLKTEAGIPDELTRHLVSALAGVDHLGTLLKVDAAVDDALRATDLQFDRSHSQGNLFADLQQQARLSDGAVKATVLDKIEAFLTRHSGAEDLGLRLDGEQLAAGVRFVRMVREGTYDIVVGNPPYHGTGKLAESSYYVDHYPEAKQDLFAGFFIRALELVKPGGRAAFITLSNWMFLSVFAGFRRVIRGQSLATVADLGKSAFTTGGTLISTTCAVVERSVEHRRAVAVRPHSPEEVVRDDGQSSRTRAALLVQRGRFEFDQKSFEVIEGEPILYWWTKDFLVRYGGAEKLGDSVEVKQGMATADNSRFLRRPWEVPRQALYLCRVESGDHTWPNSSWVPYVKGGKDRVWIEPLDEVLLWRSNMLEIRTFSDSYVKNEQFFFVPGVAFTATGADCSARLHRYRSAFDVKGQSAFPHAPAEIVTLFNSTLSRSILASLNPSVSFQVGDAKRLPMWIPRASLEIVNALKDSFDSREAARELSVEFRRPAPSSWTYAQSWAQRAVDRAEGDILPSYEPIHDEPSPDAFVSFEVGVVLGRFGATGEGVLDKPSRGSLIGGILFLSDQGRDSLDDPACTSLHAAWKEYGLALGQDDNLKTYLRTSFFEYHKRLYENRPIYFPLSSAKKNYVAFISIHRWRDDTLQVLLADHLLPEKRRLEGELDDIRLARAQATGRGKAEKRFAEVGKLLEELSDFIEKVTAVATFGPPPPDDKTPRREVDAPYVMDLDDGVMVNSAALWPLLEPQWKDPKKWWRELAAAQGRKDYDWAHLSARYFPSRVREKCVKDPSLAVAHKCFWELHPAKAYAWELRLQDEIRPDFTIDEPGSDEARARFLRDRPDEAREIVAKEAQRRARKAAKADVEDDASATPHLDRATADETEEADA